MPALPVVPGALRLRFHLTVGTDVTTGFHMFWSYSPQPPTGAQLNSLAAAARTSWQNNMVGVCPAAIILTQVDAIDLGSVTAPIGTASGPVTGTRTGNPLPASACMLVNMHIARRYRGGKPRYYIPCGVATDLATQQTWVAGFVTLFQTSFATFSGDIAANLHTWAPTGQNISVSYYSGHQWKQDQNDNWHRVSTPRTTPVIDVASSFSYNPIVGSQRRRIRST